MITFGISLIFIAFIILLMLLGDSFVRAVRIAVVVFIIMCLVVIGGSFINEGVCGKQGLLSTPPTTNLKYNF